MPVTLAPVEPRQSEKADGGDSWSDDPQRKISGAQNNVEATDPLRRGR